MTTQTTEKPRKEKLLEAARELMLDKGYVATTVDEICEQAGVTKGSFFYYFKNKEEMGKNLVQHFAQANGQKLMEGTCCESDDPLDKIFALIDCVSKMSQKSENKGCLVGIFTQELSESHPEIRNICDEIFKQTIQSFSADLEDAKKIHAPSANFDVQSLSEQLLVLIQGSLLLTKASQDRGVMERTLFHFKEYLKKLYGK